jgi:hypothetical protein
VVLFNFLAKAVLSLSCMCFSYGFVWFTRCGCGVLELYVFFFDFLAEAVVSLSCTYFLMALFSLLAEAVVSLRCICFPCGFIWFIGCGCSVLELYVFFLMVLFGLLAAVVVSFSGMCFPLICWPRLWCP